MSYRRSLSFSENEKDLVDYFDNNGKSIIAKEALRNQMDKKDIVLSDEFHEALTKLFKQANISGWNSPVKDEEKNKMLKLLKR